MRPRTLARVAAVLAVLAPSLLLAGTSQVDASPAAQEGRPYNERGFEELNDCLGSSGRVDALYVMDVSGSLESNDPDGRRFDALEASITHLGVLASAGSASLEVNVAVSTFGNGFTGPAGVRDWTTLPSDSSLGSVAGRFRDAAEGAWQDAGTSQGTDYEAALNGAGEVMRGRGSREDACQVILWFTDGLFALGDSYDRAATDAASTRMCRAGGTLDTLREENVSVIALALTGTDIDAQLRSPEHRPRRGELAAMAVGRAQGRACGTTPIPPESRSGIYLSVDEPGALGALFSGVAAQASGCAPEVLRTTLPTGFRVDRGVRRFQLDVSRADSGNSLTVRAPGEPALAVSPGTTSYAGAEVTATSSGSLLSLGVRLPTTAKRGVWSVAGGAQPTAVSLYRCSDLSLRIEQPDAPLVGGEPSELEATVVDADGEPADVAAFRGADPGSLPDITATSERATDLEAAVTDPEQGRVTVRVTPPEDRLSVDIALSFVPRLRDRQATELPAVNGSAVVPVSPPASFPTVAPATELDLGVARGSEPAEGEVTLLGSDEDGTRVCFGPAGAVDVPSGAGDVDVGASPECQELGAGEERTIAVSAASSESVEGQGRAEIPVTLENAQGDEISEDLVVRWELERAVDQGRRLWILVLAIALALALPLLVLAAVNWLLARFESGDVRHGTFGVDIAPDGVLDTRDAPRPEALSHAFLERSERRRIPSLGDSGLELLARPPRNPLGSPEFVAVARSGQRLLSEERVGRKGGTEAEVTAGLGGVWLLLVDDDALLQAAEEGPTPARLVIITRQEGQSHLDDLVARARLALADGGWSRLRDNLAAHARSSASAASGGTAAADPDGGDPDVAEDEEDPFGLGGGLDATRSPGRRDRTTDGADGGWRQDPYDDDSHEDPFA